jgi:hypothetical protein
MDNQIAPKQGSRWLTVGQIAAFVMLCSTVPYMNYESHHGATLAPDAEHPQRIQQAHAPVTYVSDEQYFRFELGWAAVVVFGAAYMGLLYVGNRRAQAIKKLNFLADAAETPKVGPQQDA